MTRDEHNEWFRVYRQPWELVQGRDLSTDRTWTETDQYDAHCNYCQTGEAHTWDEHDDSIHRTRDRLRLDGYLMALAGDPPPKPNSIPVQDELFVRRGYFERKEEAATP